VTLKVHFILRDGKKQEFDADVGQTLLDVARRHNIEIEGACGGAIACSTCHVIVDAGWYANLPPASDDETDMLDLAPGITRTSRLGCQIKLTESLNGLTVKLPQTTKTLLG
jgi:2Fe-2S ferredoxin